MQIGIAGAGIMGRLLAFTLVNAGHNITLFDPDNGSNNSCSFAAAGMLAPVSELEKSDFLIYEMGCQSIEIEWPNIISQLNQNIYFKKNGSLILSHPQDRGELKRFVGTITAVMPVKAGTQENVKKSLGASWSLSRTPIRDWHDSLNQEKIIELEPELTKFNDAYYFPSEAHIDNQALMLALETNLGQKNVEWLHASADINTHSKQFDLMIDCRGLGAKDTFSELQGIRGELIWLHAPDVNISRPIRLLHPRYSLYIVPRPKNIYLVGATEIHSEDDSEVSVRSMLELLTAVFYLHPGFAEARVLKTVTACRPTLPNYLPRIKYQDRFVAINGLYRHGFLIAPTLAKEVLRFIENGQSGLHYPQLGECHDHCAIQH